MKMFRSKLASAKVMIELKIDRRLLVIVLSNFIWMIYARTCSWDSISLVRAVIDLINSFREGKHQAVIVYKKSAM